MLRGADAQQGRRQRTVVCGQQEVARLSLRPADHLNILFCRRRPHAKGNNLNTKRS